MTVAPRPRRSVLLLTAATLVLLAAVIALRMHVASLIAQSSADLARDRFGNPYLPRFALWNARVASVDRAAAWLLWGGVLPVDLALLVVSIRACVRELRWHAVLGLVVATLVAVLLFLTALASAIPGAAMIG